jgi:hypothetical protein
VAKLLKSTDADAEGKLTLLQELITIAFWNANFLPPVKSRYR